MVISLGNNSKKALALFGLEFPFNSADLKKAYFDKLKIEHPDKHVEDSKKAHEQTKFIIEAYNHIKHLASDNYRVTPEKPANGVLTEKCAACQGTGVQYHGVKDPCPTCHGAPKLKGKTRVTVKCNKCRDGKFTLKSGREVDCLRCKGSGLVAIICPACGGKRYKVVELKSKCSSCRGKGYHELKPFNPVIPLNAVMVK